jgi:hypothetical protein
MDAAETGVDVPPSLKDFDEEIQRYKAMEKSMRALKSSKDIGWVRVDAQPLKKSLESLVSKWSYLYIKYLQDKVVNEMEELYQFMRNANKVLELKVGIEREAGEEDEEEEAETLEGEDLAAKRKEEEEQVLSSSVCLSLHRPGQACCVWCPCVTMSANAGFARVLLMTPVFYRPARTCTQSWEPCVTFVCGTSAPSTCFSL